LEANGVRAQTGVPMIQSAFERGGVLCVLLCLMLEGGAPLAYAQKYQRYEDAHLVVQKTIDDLNGVINQYPDRDQGRWQARIDRAKKNLSNVDRGLAKSKFNKRRLNAAIAAVKNVLKDDRVTGIFRDSLNADLYDLSRLRAARKK
jgi:hypothetical protein